MSPSSQHRTIFVELLFRCAVLLFDKKPCCPNGLTSHYADVVRHLKTNHIFILLGWDIMVMGFYLTFVATMLSCFHRRIDVELLHCKMGIQGNEEKIFFYIYCRCLLAAVW